MNKEQMGAFIGDCRRELGLTQRDLAERLHVTNKAVSKWERGLSYPDVTLMEPLASALGLGVEELMACRRQAAGHGEEDPVKNLLTISGNSLRRERRRSRGFATGTLILILVLAVGLAVGYNALYVTETRQASIVLKETVNGANYLYMEEKGHLLQLRCSDNVNFDGIVLDDGVFPLIYEVEMRWNRLTYKGTAAACSTTGGISLGSPMDEDPYWEKTTLFGSTVLYATEDYYPDPYAEPAGRRSLTLSMTMWAVRSWKPGRILCRRKSGKRWCNSGSDDGQNQGWPVRAQFYGAYCSALSPHSLLVRQSGLHYELPLFSEALQDLFILQKKPDADLFGRHRISLNIEVHTFVSILSVTAVENIFCLTSKLAAVEIIGTSIDQVHRQCFIILFGIQ